MLFHAILILIPFALLVLFIALANYEERRGSRLILAGSRYALDRKAMRAAFIIKHVDWGAFLWELTRSSSERLLHDLAHSTLIGVRFVERQLTSVVRVLRARRDDPLLPRKTADRPSRMQSAAALVRKTVHRTRKPLRLQVTEEAEGE
jgi:hypothetical protein